MARAEKNADLLLASRPADRPALLAWQGGLALTRAVMANEAKQPEQFGQHYRRAQDLFAEAMKLVRLMLGCSRLPVGHKSRSPSPAAAKRKASWELGYTAYQHLWKMQEQMIEKLPLHHKGEVLSGLAQTADRTGRREEAAAGIERILTLLLTRPTPAGLGSGKTIPLSEPRASWRARPATGLERWSRGSRKCPNSKRCSVETPYSLLRLGRRPSGGYDSRTCHLHAVRSDAKRGHR